MLFSHNPGMRPDASITAPLLEGFRAIRAANRVPEGESDDALLQAEATSVVIDPAVARRDATDISFVTLDPESSTDLDQAFALEREADTLVLLYAIADIGAFVASGSQLETQAWQRGVTVYAPDGSTPLYPRVLSANRASLLPDGPRPAILLTVHIDNEGEAHLHRVERIWMRSRAKLAYESVQASDLSPHLPEFAARIARAETLRGAFRLDRPVQQVVRDSQAPGGVRLQFAPRLASEDQNAALSLATNLAVGKYLFGKGLGLFRVMDEPDAREISSLRELAKTLAITWGNEETLHQLVARLDVTKERDVAFSMAIRRAGGGARYLSFPLDTASPEDQKRNGQHQSRPWHAAIAATYAHATAPMRRLADRYVLDLLLAMFAGDQPGIDKIKPILRQLPALMEAAERRASKVDRDCIELIESSLLVPLIGTTLTATVVGVSHDGWQIQIDEPAIIWRVRPRPGAQTHFGAQLQVRVVAKSKSPNPSALLKDGALTKPEFGIGTVDLLVV